MCRFRQESGRASDSLNRRELINRYLPAQTHAIPLCIFPRTGVADTWASGPSKDPMCSQPRYKLLAKNVHTRSQGGSKTWLPIYRDSMTKTPFLDDSILEEKRENHVCLDQQDIGRGSCSIQTTFQAANETEARWLHDQLIPLGPCLLAMTAATPIWKGFMVDTDCRWQRYGDLVDDRNSIEKDCLVCSLSIYVSNLYLLISKTWSYSLHGGFGIRVTFLPSSQLTYTIQSH